MRSLKFITSLALVLTISLTTLGCGNVSDKKSDTASIEQKNSSQSNQNVDMPDDKTIPIPANISNIKLQDQYGKDYTLSGLKGKTVFLNFFASWCGPCKSELKDIDELYHSLGENKNDVIVIGIANPKTSSNPNAIDASQEEILDIVKEYNVTYPILFDTTGKVFEGFGIRSFPTTFTLTKSNNVFGYINGAIELKDMHSLIENTMASK